MNPFCTSVKHVITSYSSDPLSTAGQVGSCDPFGIAGKAGGCDAFNIAEQVEGCDPLSIARQVEGYGQDIVLQKIEYASLTYGCQPSVHDCIELNIVKTILFKSFISLHKSMNPIPRLCGFLHLFNALT
ncbi:hypothetical protein AB6A40_000905 [Gnathostoma spinigerum]|uniref:Uncharacterized protein n=1 Tax=Gnathostoma spinigerum TaxID=75299 RepID=A0ABD6E498_9BILA